MAAEVDADVNPVRETTGTCQEHRRRRRTSTHEGGWAAGRWASTQQAAAVAFVVTQATVGVSNLGFHIAMSRLLGPASYGELGSLLGVFALMAVPAMAVQTMLTARVARRLAKGEPLGATALIRRSIVVGFGAAAVLLAAAPWLRDYLSLRSIASVVFLALYCVPLTAAVVPWGLLCGQRRFLTAGGIALCMAFARTGFAALLVSRGYGVAGAIAASVLSDSVGAVLLTRAARLREPDRAGAGPLSSSRGALGGVSALMGLWLLIGVDWVLSRHLFAPVLAGQYNAAATVSRVMYFLAQTLCLVAVPIYAGGNRRQARVALRWTLLVTAACGVITAAVFELEGGRLLHLLFGASFQVPSNLLALTQLAATGLAMLWILLHYQLARGAPAGAAWLGLAVAIGLGTTLVRTPYQLAVVMLTGGLFAAVVAAGRGHRHDHSQRRLARRTEPLAPPAADAVDLTVVVPFYNPGQGLRDNVLSLLSALRDSGVRFEVITVSDGCTDGSAESIADLDPNTVRQLALPRNGGKGAALRLGLREGRGRYLGFIDADGDLDPQLWRPFLSLVKLYEPDAVIGAKCHPLSEVYEGPHGIRRLYSSGYRGLVRVLFPTLRVRETQVGIKVFRRELLADVLPRTVEHGFIFDLELLTVAHRLGYRRILPAPVRLQRAGPSTVSAAVVWRMFVGTVALAWRVWAIHAYDPAPPTRRLGDPTDPLDAVGGRIPVPSPRLGFGEVW